MKTYSFAQAMLRAGVLSSVAFGSISLSQAAAATVHLQPGDNIQKAVAANRPGTTFLLSAGNYRGQVINPKDNDTFIGQGSVYLIGSQVLDFNPDPQGTGLFVADAPVINQTYGKCATATPLCGYPQDLYIHSIPQVVALSTDDLADGSWYFDRDAKKVYLASDPGNTIVEIGVSPYAFSSIAENVTIKNLVVENYANFAQFGAIGAQKTGPGWVVQGVRSRYNHGVGIRLGTGGQIIHCKVEMNGEMGISVNGENSSVISTVIAGNNYAGYSLNWEGGGSKFSNTTNALFSHNNVHDNIGPGLWGDSDNIGTVFDSNVIWNNLTAGIQYEISYAAVISNNTLYGNGIGDKPVWLWNAQISVQNSSDVQVFGNTVEVSTRSGNGISVINQNRHPGALGPHIAQNDYVYNNTITYDYTIGKSGMVNDTGVLNEYNNRFYDNTYILKAGDSEDQHWAWFHYYDWKDFRAASDQEQGGSVKIDKDK